MGGKGERGQAHVRCQRDTRSEIPLSTRLKSETDHRSSVMLRYVLERSVLGGTIDLAGRPVRLAFNQGALI